MGTGIRESEIGNRLEQTHSRPNARLEGEGFNATACRVSAGYNATLSRSRVSKHASTGARCVLS